MLNTPLRVRSSSVASFFRVSDSILRRKHRRPIRITLGVECRGGGDERGLVSAVQRGEVRGKMGEGEEGVYFIVLRKDFFYNVHVLPSLRFPCVLWVPRYFLPRVIPSISQGRTSYCLFSSHLSPFPPCVLLLRLLFPEVAAVFVPFAAEIAVCKPVSISIHGTYRVWSSLEGVPTYTLISLLRILP